MRRTPRLRALLLAFLLVTASGCAERITRQSKLSDAEIFARAERLAAEKSWGAAAEHYQVLLEKYPSSPLAPRAQLGMAEARMERGDDVDAEAAFDDFLRLYPSDDNVPHALSRKGDLLARGAADPGRDQTKTVEAIRAYELLLSKEGAGPRADRARGRIRELRGRLAEHEVLVVRHYMKRKLFDGAETRAGRASAEYADTPAAPILKSLRADALERLGRAADAAALRAEIGASHPAQPGGKR